MKIMKSYRQLIPLVGIPLAGLSAFFLYFSSLVVEFFKIHWLALGILLILAIGHKGGLRLAPSHDEKPRYTLWSWLARIFGVQICLYALFLGITTACAQTSSVFTVPQTGLFQQTLSKLLVGEGLMPWGFTALTSIAIGRVSYCLGKDAFLADTVKFVQPHTAVWVAVNFIGRAATFLAYSAAFAFITLLGASAAAHFSTVMGFSLTPVLVTSLLLLITVTKIYRTQINRLLGKEIPLIPGLFLWAVFLGVMIWLLNGFLAPWTHQPMAPPSLLKHWLDQPWRELWLIFANSWWVMLTPLMSVTLARISRGYRVREVIAGILVLPLCVSLILTLISGISGDISPVAATFIGAAGLIGLLFMTLHKEVLPSFVLVNLPREDRYKFRPYQRLFFHMTRLTILFLFLYMPGGLTLIHWLVFIAAWPLIFIFLF